MSDILNQIKELEDEARNALETAIDKASLDEASVIYLGRKGKINEISRGMGQIDADLRPKVGAEINRLKKSLQALVEKRIGDFSTESVSGDIFDHTLPGKRSFVGHRHPLMQTVDRIVQIFRGMGFSVASGPDIDTDFNNFDALNTPEDHPARDLSDTFYIKKGVLLRTHTSTVQIRTMQSQKPPVRIISPGRCYRSDTPDASHSPVFYQCEGLFVDEHVTFGDLKGVIIQFASDGAK